MRTVEAYHISFPLRRGMPREELKSRLKLPPRVIHATVRKLVADGLFNERPPYIAKTGHEVTFNGQEQAQVRGLMRRFEQNPFSPPGVKECREEIGEEVLNALIDMGELVPVSADVLFRKPDYDSMIASVRAVLARNGQVTLAETRDLFGTSRKYAQALLEHLDAGGVTVRDGDFRRLKHP
jgi:selenocysteine-specific elongation factor